MTPQISSPEAPKLWHITRFSLFSWLSPKELRELAERTEMVRCRRGTTFFFGDDPSESVFLVKEGRIKLTRITQDGQEVILDILGPGEIFGELAVTREKTRSHGAEAQEDALVCIILRSEFETLMERHPEMALRVLKLVGLRRLGLVETAYRSLCLTAPEKLRRHLAESGATGDTPPGVSPG